MIDSHTFTAEHIQNIRTKSGRDPVLIERVIFAFGLLETIARSGLPFIFKGGTSMMLLMDKPRRFSTDIDIMVEPGTNIDEYLERAADISLAVTAKRNVSCTPTGSRQRLRASTSLKLRKLTQTNRLFRIC